MTMLVAIDSTWCALGLCIVLDRLDADTVFGENRLGRSTSLRATVTTVVRAASSQGPHLAATPQERSVRLELPLFMGHAADTKGLREAIDVVAV